MKRNILKFTAYVILVVFTTLQIAWAEEPVPIPCVAQLPPEGLRPVTDPNWLIGDKPSLPGPQLDPGAQPSQKFLEGGSPLSLSTGELVTIEPFSPPDVQPVPPIEDKPFQFTGESNSISMISKKEKKEEKEEEKKEEGKEEKKEEEASSEKHPGITTDNPKDLIENPAPPVTKSKFSRNGTSGTRVSSEVTKKKHRHGRRRLRAGERNKR